MPILPRRYLTWFFITLCCCSSNLFGQGTTSGGGTREEPAGDVLSILAGAFGGIADRAEAIEDKLLPVRLLRPAEEAALRQSSNAEHIALGRQMGITPQASEAGLTSMVDSGQLIRLSEQTAQYRVRELDASMPYVVPQVEDLLVDLATRFHKELKDLGLPHFRLEVTSVLRTGKLQAALRTTNENAARGRSSHEFGTTVDIAYEGFAAPLLSDQTAVGEPLASLLRQFEAVNLERIAGRKSRELTAILGRVLIKMQEEGRVLVLMERLQPVFHITIMDAH